MLWRPQRHFSAPPIEFATLVVIGTTSFQLERAGPAGAFETARPAQRNIRELQGATQLILALTLQ